MMPYTDSVTLYSMTQGISTLGENILLSTTGSTLRCKVRPLSNSERFYQNRNNLETTHRMYCAYTTIFDTIDRVVYKDSTFEITGIINPFEKNDFLQVDLKAVT